jgi:hypothetical protein
VASDRNSWVGCFANTRATTVDLKLVAPLARSTAGGSGAFLGAASDSRQYWVKPPNNGQGTRVPVTEQIVGRIGRLIGAPTCDVRTIEIAHDLAGWEFRPGLKLEAGIAHASLAVPDAVETRDMARRSEDSNATRHVGILALYDLCWGGDAQWLTSTSREHEYYSHDHGWYLPPEGSSWAEAEMIASLSAPHEFVDPLGGAGLDRATIDAMAARLDALTQAEITVVLSMIPRTWSATDDELEVVGHFLLHRAPLVAARLRGR